MRHLDIFQLLDGDSAWVARVSEDGSIMGTTSALPILRLLTEVSLWDTSSGGLQVRGPGLLRALEDQFNTPEFKTARSTSELRFDPPEGP